MVVARRELVSEAAFLALPESVDKVELVDGEVLVSPSPSYWHQELLRRLVVALSQWAEGSAEPVTIGQAPLDVRFRPGRILQPDAFVLLARVGEEHEGPIDAVPELCVEILSRDRAYDRITKRLIYAEAGVREFWAVEQSGLVERWTGERLEVSQELSERLTTPLLPGFELDLGVLFRRP